jgi:hypothetical protein
MIPIDWGVGEEGELPISNLIQKAPPPPEASPGPTKNISHPADESRKRLKPATRKREKPEA